MTGLASRSGRPRVAQWRDRPGSRCDLRTSFEIKYPIRRKSFPCIRSPPCYLNGGHQPEWPVIRNAAGSSRPILLKNSIPGRKISSIEKSPSQIAPQSTIVDWARGRRPQRISLEHSAKSFSTVSAKTGRCQNIPLQTFALCGYAYGLVCRFSRSFNGADLWARVRLFTSPCASAPI